MPTCKTPMNWMTFTSIQTEWIKIPTESRKMKVRETQSLHFSFDRQRTRTKKKTDSSGRKTAFLESFGELGRWNYLWRFAGEEWRRGGSSGGNRSQCGQLRMMGDSCRKRERERERQSPSEIKEKPKWKTEKERFFFFFFFFKSSWEEVTPVSMREKQVQS